MLRAAPWMPPDCSASLRVTAQATALFDWELTAPTPKPPRAIPANSAPVTPCAWTPKAMSAQAQAMAMNPVRMMRREERCGASLGKKVARRNIGMPDRRESMPVCSAVNPVTSWRYGVAKMPTAPM